MGILDSLFKKDNARQVTQPEQVQVQAQAQDNIIPLQPEKEFGAQLMQLVDVALSDKILTTSERAMLHEIAITKNVNLDRFDAYLDMLKEKRGISEIVDGNVPLKKYNQPTGVAAELKTMIDMALADGYLSDEERGIILNEAAKLGVNIPAFEKGLNAIFMTGRIKEVINSKYPTTITKRLVKSEDIADGNVVETYEEITTTFRPNTNRGKTNEILKTTTKRIIKLTRKKETIEEVLDFLCKVDYNLVLSALSVVTIFNPAIGGIAIGLVTSLKGGVDKMNKTSQKKDLNLFIDVVFSSVSEQCVEVLPQVQNYLGNNGDKIVSGIMTVHKAYKAKKS